MTNLKPSLQVDTILNWPFELETKSYSSDDASRYAAGFGAGLPGALQAGDAAFLNGEKALPFMCVPLADGEFWHADPRTGIAWQKMVHAGESITIHKPLPASGELQLSQKVNSLLDRGEQRGAVMLQQLDFADGTTPYATIDVTMMLLANGGFGGEPDERPRDKWVPDDRPADLTVEVQTPKSDDDLVFELKVDLDVAAGGKPNQKPLRGVCSFGLAGRAALHLLCDNQPERLRHFSVKYAGMMFSDETMLVEVWYLAAGKAALRMSSLEREQLVLNHCLVAYDI